MKPSIQELFDRLSRRLDDLETRLKRPGELLGHRSIFTIDRPGEVPNAGRSNEMKLLRADGTWVTGSSGLSSISGTNIGSGVAVHASASEAGVMTFRSLTGSGVSVVLSGSTIVLSSSQGSTGSASTFTGTSGSIPFVGGSGFLSESNSQLYWKEAGTGSVLGIGIANPASALYGFANDLKVHIHRSGALVGENQRHNFVLIDCGGSGTDSGIYFSTLTAPNDVAIFVDESDGQKLKFAAGFIDTDAQRVSGTHMTITQDGRVGWGTSNPVSADLYSFTSDINWHFHRYRAHSFLLIDTVGTGTDAGLYLATRTLNVDAVMFLDESDEGKLKFALGTIPDEATRLSQTHITITQTGTLGIGTTSPQDPVHVKKSMPGLNCFRAENTSATGYSSFIVINNAGVYKGGFGHDNANNWNYLDSTADNLFYITGASSTDGVIGVRNLVATGYSGINFFKTAGTFGGSIGYANTTAGLTHLRNLNYIYTNTGSTGWVFADGTAIGVHIDATRKYLGIGQNASPSYPLDVRSASTAAKVHIASTTADDGLYLISAQASQAIMAGGVAYNSAGTWTAKATTMSAVDLVLGTTLFYGATGQVAGTVGIAMTMKMLIWSNGNVNIGLTNADPGIKLRIEGLSGSAGIELGTGTTLPVSAASTGRLRYDATVQKFQASLNGLAYGDVLGGNGLTWLPTTFRIGIGTAATAPAYAIDIRDANAGSECISIRSLSTTGYSDVVWFDSANAQKGAIGWGNSSVGNTLASKNFFYTPALDWVMSNGTTDYFRWYTAASAIGFEMANGGSAAVSAASTGKIRYNTTGQKLQASHNGAAYFDVGTYAAALTAGSITFANASNQLAQDNAKLFWDSTNKILAIGTTTPAAGVGLDVRSTASNFAAARFINTHTGGYSSVDFNDSALAHKFAIGYGNSAVAFTPVQLKNYFYTTGPDFVMANTTRNEFEFQMSSGSASFQMQDAPGAVVSSALTARLRYNLATNKLQVSKNGAAYIDII